MVKYMTAGVVGSALLATVAFAQSPSTTSDSGKTATTNSSSSDSSYQGTWRASKIIGLSVYNDRNESVGSINDLLTDKSGNIKAAVIGVGGFLGVGEHLVAVPMDKIRFVTEPVAYTGASANSGGNRPAGSTSGTGMTGTGTSTTTTTGAAGGSTNTSPASASKPNPWYPDHAVYNATKDELKAMPEFKYNTM